MSFGLEPIYELIKDNEDNKLNKYDIYVYSFNNDKYLFEISNLLRKNNYKVLTELNNIKLKKALNIANRENIKYMIIIGEEIKDKKIVLKNMYDSTQITIDIDKLLDEIK